MARYCRNCGTEVDDTAVFCPTCGQPVDDADSAEIPAAPAWPDRGQEADDAAPAADRDAPGNEAPPAARGWEEEREREPEPADVPTRIEQRPPPPPDTPPSRPEPASSPAPSRPVEDDAQSRPSGSSGPQIDLPITTPVTLTGWLIGIGSVLAVLGLVVILVAGVFNVIDLLLLLALLGIAATVWFSARLPAVPQVRLVTLVVTLIAFGVALDRIALGRGSAGDLLLFLGSATAAMGAILLELGQDQPLGGPQR